jgi:hypothetical protein
MLFEQISGAIAFHPLLTLHYVILCSLVQSPDFARKRNFKFPQWPRYENSRDVVRMPNNCISSLSSFFFCRLKVWEVYTCTLYAYDVLNTGRFGLSFLRGNANTVPAPNRVPAVQSFSLRKILLFTVGFIDALTANLVLRPSVLPSKSLRGSPCAKTQNLSKTCHEK